MTEAATLLRAAGPEQGPSSRTALSAALWRSNAGRFAQRVGNASVSVSEPGFHAVSPLWPAARSPACPRGARLVAAIGGARHPDGLQERGEGRIIPPRRLRKAELVLQHGDGRAVGVSVRKALLELGGIIPARANQPPLTQKAPIGEARALSVQLWGFTAEMGGCQIRWAFFVSDSYFR